MAINVFVPKFHTEEILEEIRECLDKGWTGMGFKTVEFEDHWKAYTGLPHAHFLNSATAGLHLAVHMLKKKYGWNGQDEIISTPLTFVSTNHAILYERLKPVFCDVDEYLCLDPEEIKTNVNKKPDKNTIMNREHSKYPFVCPVCGGNGLVPNGFYSQTGGQWSTTDTTPEECRTCNGTGIVWG